MVQPISANFSSAANAYNKIGSGVAGKPSANPVASQRLRFSEFMADSLNGTRETLRNAEQAQIEGLNGRLSSQEVVEAVMAAELTIQTVTAVRDRAVQAYQELLRMPV